MSLDDEDRQRGKEKDKRQQRKDDVAWVLSSRSGRRFVAQLIATTGVDLPVFDNSGSKMNHSEGRRSVGIEVLAEIKSQHQDAYLQMVTEAIRKVD